MGIRVNPANAAAAVSAGLGTTGSGVSYLLSDGYGTDSTVASGVGIQISRTNGSALNLLSTLSGSALGGNAAGWYPVLDGATAGAVVSGMTTYTKTLNATLKALPGKTVTAGKKSARRHRSLSRCNDAKITGIMYCRNSIALWLGASQALLLSHRAWSFPPPIGERSYCCRTAMPAGDCAGMD